MKEKEEVPSQTHPLTVWMFLVAAAVTISVVLWLLR